MGVEASSRQRSQGIIFLKRGKNVWLFYITNFLFLKFDLIVSYSKITGREGKGKGRENLKQSP